MTIPPFAGPHARSGASSTFGGADHGSGLLKLLLDASATLNESHSIHVVHRRRVHGPPDRLQRRDRATRRAEHAPPHISGNNRHAELTVRQQQGWGHRYPVPPPLLPDQPTRATKRRRLTLADLRTDWSGVGPTGVPANVNVGVLTQRTLPPSESAAKAATRTAISASTRRGDSRVCWESRLLFQELSRRSRLRRWAENPELCG